MQIDHAVLAVPDLDEAGRRLRERFGLGSTRGGVHPRWGTANRIVPLARGYLELMGVGDPATAATTELGRRVMAAAGSPSPWVTWVVGTEDLDRIARRLGLDVVEGWRERPDGSTLRWRMGGLDEALAEPPLPFFIEWESARDHPGATPVDHVADPRGITRIEVAGDAARLRRWIGDAPLPIGMVEGPPGVRALGVATDGGDLTILGTEISPASA